MSDATLHLNPNISTPPADVRIAITRGRVDTVLFVLFESKAIRRSLRDHDKLNLVTLGARAQTELAGWLDSPQRLALEPIDVHERLVRGLPGQALFISASLAFDSLAEALPFFDVTAKTAWQKIEKSLSPAESEQALRLGRVATIASELFGSPEAGRQYLRTPNYALGGSTPLELLRTGEGEQLVLNELQTQSAGGPV